MSRSVLTVLFVLLSFWLIAHEFWLQPDHFFIKPGQSVQLSVLVGEGFVGERSEGKKNRIIHYRHYTTGDTTNLTPALTGDSYGETRVLIRSAGTHLFSFANTPKFLAMRADSFLLYLQEDGLDDIIALRKRQGQTGKNSRELYQRCAKTLVQAGEKPDRTFAVNTGMPLEIIPVENPYSLRSGQIAGFRILFNNKPLSNAWVRYWNRNDTPNLVSSRKQTDASGQVRFRLQPGRTMISLVKMIPNPDTTQADWHSYWGSLTFGCRPTK